MDELALRFRENAQLQPYMVFSAGRSRTMWLSAYLTYGICACHFEATAKVSNLSEVLTWLSIPGMGAAETLAAPAWPLLLTAAPTMKVLIVRRSLEEILDSLLAASKDRVQLDLEGLRRMLSYIARALDRLALQPQALVVDFHELAREETCKAAFEHCLPYKHDHGWWNFMQAKNIQSDVIQLAALYQSREQQIKQLGRECRHMLFRLARSGHFQHLVGHEGTLH